MSTNDQLFATILLASGLLMTPDHRAQLVALSKGVATATKPVEVVMQAVTASVPAETKPKKIKPRATAANAPVSMSLPPVPTPLAPVPTSLAPMSSNSSASDFLAPVDMTPITIVTTTPAPVTSATTTAATTIAPTVAQNSASNASYPNDALCTHRYRIAAPDHKFCMARRWNEDAPIPGTETSAATSNGKIYPEQQCTRFPAAGAGICATCAKAEQAYLSNPASPPVAAKRWRGRLDGPLFANAPFLGSDLFWKKYPQGLPGDPTTAAPAEWIAANATTKAKPKTKAVAVAAATAANTSAVATEYSSTVTAPPMPVRPKAPVEEWVLALIGDSSYIYERATLKCYEADMSITSSTKAMARLDRYAGKYEPATNSINLYGSESDEE